MLSANNIVALRCEGSVEGNRFLDGRTLEGSAAPPTTDVPPFTGHAVDPRRRRRELFLRPGASRWQRFSMGVREALSAGTQRQPPFTGHQMAPHRCRDRSRATRVPGHDPRQSFPRWPHR